MEFLVGPFGASVFYGVGIGAVVFVISTLGIHLGILGRRLAGAMLCFSIALMGMFPAWMTAFFASALLGADDSTPFGMWAFTFVLTLVSVWLTLSAVSAYRRVSADVWARL